MSASVDDYEPTMRVLLDHGANVNLRDSEYDVTQSDLGRTFTTHHSGRAALQYANEFGYSKAVQILLKHGADVEVRDNYGCTVLRSAVGSGDTNMVQIVLAAGADVNAKDNWGDTPLIVAANNGYADIVCQLISKGAYLNVRNKDGETALVNCVMTGGESRTLMLLLKQGADVSVKSAKGETALSFARKNNNSKNGAAVAALWSKRIARLRLRPTRHDWLLRTANTGAQPKYRRSPNTQHRVQPNA